jgi:putative hydrolase of the HAD superfamily
MPYTTLFFDLDDTLYPNTNGLWGAIRERMDDYLRERLGVPPEQVLSLRRRYFETYGTTLRGLQHHHQVDPHDFLDYVHDLPLEQYLTPDPELHSLVEGLPQRKWVLTNADIHHARRVLAILGLADCFAGIIDIHALEYTCKPEPEAYRKAMSLAGETVPGRCLLCDDSPRNLAPARALGFTTVLVGVNLPDPAADFAIPNLKALRNVLPELWLDRGRL